MNQFFAALKKGLEIAFEELDLLHRNLDGMRMTVLLKLAYV